MSKRKTCPVCGHQQSEKINDCEQCGWDFPVMLGSGDAVATVFASRLAKAKEQWRPHTHITGHTSRVEQSLAFNAEIRLDNSSSDSEENAVDERAWQQAVRKNSLDAYKDYLANPENQRYRVEALRKIASLDLLTPSDADGSVISSERALAAQQDQVIRNIQWQVFFQRLLKGLGSAVIALKWLLQFFAPATRAVGRALAWGITNCWRFIYRVFNAVERQLADSFASPLVSLLFWAAGLVIAFAAFIVLRIILFNQMDELLSQFVAAVGAIFLYALWVKNPYLSRYRFWSALITGVLIYLSYGYLSW